MYTSRKQTYFQDCSRQLIMFWNLTDLHRYEEFPWVFVVIKPLKELTDFVLIAMFIKDRHCPLLSHLNLVYTLSSYPYWNYFLIILPPFLDVKRANPRVFINFTFFTMQTIFPESIIFMIEWMQVCLVKEETRKALYYVFFPSLVLFIF